MKGSRILRNIVTPMKRYCTRAWNPVQHSQNEWDCTRVYARGRDTLQFFQTVKGDFVEWTRRWKQFSLVNTGHDRQRASKERKDNSQESCFFASSFSDAQTSSVIYVHYILSNNGNNERDNGKFWFKQRDIPIWEVRRVKNIRYKRRETQRQTKERRLKGHE